MDYIPQRGTLKTITLNNCENNCVRVSGPDSPLTGEGSVSDSVSSLEDSPVSLPHRQRESPEPGEASDDDQHLQHYQRQCRVNNTSFCLPLLETQHTCTTSNYF